MYFMMTKGSTLLTPWNLTCWSIRILEKFLVRSVQRCLSGKCIWLWVMMVLHT